MAEAHDVAARTSGYIDPMSLLDKAFRQLQRRAAPPPGSSTATLLTYDDETRIIETANLGDSGFYLYQPRRPWRYMSEDQQKYISLRHMLINVHTCWP